MLFFWCFSFIFISWMLITLQYYSEYCHTLTWISHGFTCIPHPDPLSHLPLYPISLGLPSAPGPSTCLMHPDILKPKMGISTLHWHEKQFLVVRSFLSIQVYGCIMIYNMFSFQGNLKQIHIIFSKWIVLKHNNQIIDPQINTLRTH